MFGRSDAQRRGDQQKRRLCNKGAAMGIKGVHVLSQHAMARISHDGAKLSFSRDEFRKSGIHADRLFWSNRWRNWTLVICCCHESDVPFGEENGTPTA